MGWRPGSGGGIGGSIRALLRVDHVFIGVVRAVHGLVGLGRVSGTLSSAFGCFSQGGLRPGDRVLGSQLQSRNP